MYTGNCSKGLATSIVQTLCCDHQPKRGKLQPLHHIGLLSTESAHWRCPSVEWLSSLVSSLGVTFGNFLLVVPFTPPLSPGIAGKSNSLEISQQFLGGGGALCFKRGFHPCRSVPHFIWLITGFGSWADPMSIVAQLSGVFSTKQMFQNLNLSSPKSSATTGHFFQRVRSRLVWNQLLKYING